MDRLFRTLRNLWRILQMARILARHNALFPLAQVPHAAPVMAVARLAADKRAPGRDGERLARALQELGPTFIKLGQAISTRGDLVGEVLARDLALLQDRLPAFPGAQARRLVEQDLERPLQSLFATFDETPVAAASIAQVHFAETVEGAPVAVKILRPGIERAVNRDLDFFLWLAELIEWLHPPIKRYKPVMAVSTFATSTRREMDLRLEAAAAAEFAQNCEDLEGFRVPSVDWRRTSRRVVTFERVHGLQADEQETLLAHGLDPDLILQNAAVAFFTQVFRDGFFHGDMHPGNMMIDATTGDIIALDFGIMGRLDMPTRRHLGEILVGFLTRDYKRVGDVFFRAGYIPAHQDKAAFTQACRALGEPILGLPLNEISFGRLLGQLLFMAEQFEMESQPQLLLLQKTMVIAEGVGRALNPTVNIWQLAEPLVRGWIIRNLGPQAKAKAVAADGWEAMQRVPEIIGHVQFLLEMIAEREKIPLQAAWNRSLQAALIGAGFLFGFVVALAILSV